ncbi:hypothetical protein [Pseudodesulfovibrio senegalensis]|uniref:Uncharacterized protein n=1 Tax=Pseudodesulfovibrio senegalensis TaxID=1721087 RepID=A0A6N6N5H7_9BACT|nr:hypothetical protein [Pseudodesulfovibrio senegalensis]KAB1443314.1 hypothetical protein F8A88_03375 [Pseudodesulfovibrio senegalensis]
MSESILREHIRTTILNRVEEQDQDKRAEALAEFMAVTGVAPREETMQSVATMVPPIVHDLYEKWIGMFTDRLLETAPRNAVEMLCDGTEENSAALVLAYIMFLESERMEKQIDEDLAEYGQKMTGSDEMGDLASSYIRARLSAMADKAGK